MNTMRLAVLSLIVLLGHATAYCPSSFYKLRMLDKSKGAPEAKHAACLDGSTPSYYIRPGKGQDAKKLLIFLQEHNLD